MERYLESETKQMATYEIVEQLMREHGDRTLRIVYQYVKNRQVAEDLTQEIFEKCFHKIHTFKGNSSIETWLYRMTVNHTIDYLRSWHAKNMLIDEVTIAAQACSTSIEAEAMSSETDYELLAAVNSLEKKYREVIQLFYFAELTSREIADALKISENTVKTRLRKAKQLLEKQLGDA